MRYPRSRLFKGAAIIVLALNFTACATATRGSSTLFIVETTPVGAKATTTIPTSDFTHLSLRKIEKVKNGEMEPPDVNFRYCEPTPCGIEIPRKKNFHVMVTKDGYEPQIHEIGYLHRKKIKKETQRNTALAATATGASGAVIGASLASSFATVGTGAVATSAAVFAAPAIMVGGVSLIVDSSTGANYDPWPNPLPLVLKIEDEGEESLVSRDLIDEFKKLQDERVLKPRLTPSKQQQIELDKKIEENKS